MSRSFGMSNRQHRAIVAELRRADQQLHESPEDARRESFALCRQTDFSPNSEILPEHANHPGWEANNCDARITVTPVWGACHSGGFACGVTGGHCLPDKDKCPTRQKKWAEPDK